ncbi:hypothetical protein Cgig2_031214 [Carnegiea gigantea]|uniref:Vps72/YL1 N-terminal domain-containing protein n=1 Tax=Carnegiea gigantea TaxID=171969 RepID=A0A9Q1GHZ0_9CARY|nr:hypothetical protein Cgig2_031214 [Carnegiea gigantea]
MGRQEQEDFGPLLKGEDTKPFKDQQNDNNSQIRVFVLQAECSGQTKSISAEFDGSEANFGDGGVPVVGWWWRPRGSGCWWWPLLLVVDSTTSRRSDMTKSLLENISRETKPVHWRIPPRPIKRKKEGEEKRMTQEEMLLEAAQTEIMNLRNLERVLAREEEVKKRAIVHKPEYTGPQIRYFSKDG